MPLLVKGNHNVTKTVWQHGNPRKLCTGRKPVITAACKRNQAAEYAETGGARELK